MNDVLLTIWDVWAWAWSFREVNSWWFFLNFYLYNSCTLIANFAPDTHDYNEQYACDSRKNYEENSIHECEFSANRHNFLSWIGFCPWLNNHIRCFIYYRYIVTRCWIARWVSLVWWIWGRRAATTASIVCRVTRVIYLLLDAVGSRISDNYYCWGASRETLSTSTLSSLVVNCPIISLQESLARGNSERKA